MTKQIKRPEQSCECADALKDQYLLRRFWENAAGFWGKGGTAVVLGSGRTSSAHHPSQPRHFLRHECLDSRDLRRAAEEGFETILLLSMVYLPLLAASVTFSVLQVYARMTTQRRWREWLNNQLVNRWFMNARYYQLNLARGAPRNPEYRVADDVRIATESPVDFVTGMITAVLVGGDIHCGFVDDRRCTHGPPRSGWP